MHKTKLFILVLLACFASAGLDFYLNGYYQTMQSQAGKAETVSDKSTELINLVKTVDETLEVNKKNNAHNLFNKVDLSKIEIIKETNAIFFGKNSQNFFSVYLFKFKAQTDFTNYLALKEILNTIGDKEKSVSINETNEFGSASFYINDVLNEVVSLIILTPNGVVGVEYPIELKESVIPKLKEIFQKAEIR